MRINSTFKHLQAGSNSKKPLYHWLLALLREQQAIGVSCSKLKQAGEGAAQWQSGRFER